MVGFESTLSDYLVTPRDVSLYALAVGATLESPSSPHLRYIYERHSQFAPLPTFGVLPAMQVLKTMMDNGIPGMEIDLSSVIDSAIANAPVNNLFLYKILHGEQYLSRVGPAPTDACLSSSFRVSAVLDKRRVGAVVVIDVVTKDKDTGVDIWNNQVSFQNRCCPRICRFRYC